ncbi:MAG: hypothetical protein H7A21_08760 [Spirochaetales bacterium]|nr:hypothetical protein [Leptospiraceae bacterium]MCP5481508.1 hypothetical protein [Spirochaetales bacterium]MCP5484337.1 hypothetical protein [Spirochaetales bacterium]
MFDLRHRVLAVVCVSLIAGFSAGWHAHQENGTALLCIEHDCDHSHNGQEQTSSPLVHAVAGSRSSVVDSGVPIAPTEHERLATSELVPIGTATRETCPHPLEPHSTRPRNRSPPANLPI